MSDIKDYLVLRYSLIEERQKAIDIKTTPKVKGRAILCAIDNDREFKYNGVLYSVLGFHSLEPSFGYEYPPNRLYLGKIARVRKQQTGERIPGDIIEYEHDNWIPITVVIDVHTQHIFARKDWRFGTPDQIAKSIQAALNEPVLSVYNHRVFVEGKTEPGIFWSIVGSKNKIYRLELKLISPNILDTNERARDALKSLKEIFDQEEIDIALKNEAGELKVPQEPVSNYLDYIAEGEGSWKIVTEGERGGKKSHSSSENIDTISLPAIDNEKIDTSQLELGDDTGSEQPNNYEEANLGAEVYATVKDMEED